MRAYLITDQSDDEALLGQAMRLAGLRLRTTENMQAVVRKWPEAPADLVAVALREPAPHVILRELRPPVEAPLLFVVDPIAEDKHISLLQAGADWIIERPYNLRLLTAYLRVWQRWSHPGDRAARPQLMSSDVALEAISRTVRVSGASPQRLSQLEYRLLHTLMSNPGQAMPPETIVEHVWGYTGEGDRSLVRGLINRLRTKIERDPHHPQYILTVPGVGYAFGESEEE